MKNNNIFLWNLEWNEEGVLRAEILRLIYQGRFLHGNVTLGALGLPPGRTSVMHLVPRETLPEPNSQGKFLLFFPKFYNYTLCIFCLIEFPLLFTLIDQRQKSKSGRSSCCPMSCTVL